MEGNTCKPLKKRRN